MLKDGDCLEVQETEIQDGKVGEAGAVFAFMGWLTCRDEVSGPFSARHEASEAARLAGKFCEWQGWKIENEDWHRHIKPYREHNAPFDSTGIEPLVESAPKHDGRLKEQE